jgi:hypothetical protein
MKIHGIRNVIENELQIFLVVEQQFSMFRHGRPSYGWYIKRTVSRRDLPL